MKNSGTLCKGAMGEECALQFLLSKNMVLLGRNVRIGHKEVDLVMEDTSAIHFVEVKSCFTAQRIKSNVAEYQSSYNALFSPGSKVGPQKRQNLMRAADSFLRSKKIDKNALFDIVLVNFERSGAYFVEFIEDAFNAVTR